MTLTVGDTNSQWQPQSVAVRYTTHAWFREYKSTQTKHAVLQVCIEHHSLHDYK